jgi:hypothetical protein
MLLFLTAIVSLATMNVEKEEAAFFASLDDSKMVEIARDCRVIRAMNPETPEEFAEDVTNLTGLRQPGEIRAYLKLCTMIDSSYRQD